MASSVNGRVLADGGSFAFTTRLPTATEVELPYEQQIVGGFEIFSHAPAHVETLLTQHAFTAGSCKNALSGTTCFCYGIAAKH